MAKKTHSLVSTKSSSLYTLALIEPLLSYESLVQHEYYKPEFMHATVPGALQRYDLVDLNKCITPRELAIFNPLDHTGRIASEAQVQNFKTALSRHYDGLKSSDKLKFFVNFQPQKIDSALAFY